MAFVVLIASPFPATFAQAPETPIQTQPASTAQPAEPHYWLRVTGERVNVRSRADLNSRIVGRVERDDVLEGVGSEFGWHKIVPPEGVYSLVGAAYIERIDEQRGLVKVGTTLRVRVGSDIMPRDPLQSEVQARLPRDTEVRILGPLDAEWLKIVPPEGVYAYVSGEFVETISAEVANRLRPARPAGETETLATVATRPSGSQPVATTTQPIEPPALTGEWGRRLGWALETIQKEELKPLEEQRWDGVRGHLGPIAEQREQPQIAEYAAAWIRKLDQRIAQQAVAREARAIARQTDADKARHARELEKLRRAKVELKPRPEFDAQGVLRPSFVLQAGPYGMRYKVQDPFTHKVEAYVEFPTELGIDVAATIGKYVGVRGEKQSIEGVKTSVLRVTRLTVLNPEKPKSPPAREIP